MCQGESDDEPGVEKATRYSDLHCYQGMKIKKGACCRQYQADPENPLYASPSGSIDTP